MGALLLLLALGLSTSIQGQIHNSTSIQDQIHNDIGLLQTQLRIQQEFKTKGALFEPSLTNLGGEGCTSSAPCPICTGDCDNDNDCQGAFRCFHREGSDGQAKVIGCAVGGNDDVNNYDYCFNPASIPAFDGTLVNIGRRGCEEDAALQCTECQGDCDNDNDCAGDLFCFHRGGTRFSGMKVINCDAGGPGDMPVLDYCVNPANFPSNIVTAPDGTETKTLQNFGLRGCEPDRKCEECQGDCDVDADCDDAQQLICFHRQDGAQVMGCVNGGEGDVAVLDYCFKVPPQNSFPAGQLVNMGFGGCASGNTWHPCGLCHGDCDNDNECDGDLRCFRRFDMEKVMGCDAGGDGDVSNVDFCFDPAQVPDNESPPPATTHILQFLGITGCETDAALKCSICQGDCDVDADCEGTLRCFHRNTMTDGTHVGIPGCESGSPPDGDISWADYCWNTNSLAVNSLVLGTGGLTACTPSATCPKCRGDCDTDEDCENTLRCYHRNQDPATQNVPGCTMGGGGDISYFDYCWDIGDLEAQGSGNTLPLRSLGWKGCSTEHPCTACRGDCDNDNECASGHICFKRNEEATRLVPVTGCAVQVDATIDNVPLMDYCIQLASVPVIYPQLQSRGRTGCKPGHSVKCTACHGQCETDEDCDGDNLRCFVRSDSTHLVPGCTPGGHGDVGTYNYCWDTTQLPDNAGGTVLQYLGENGCTTDRKCNACQGDCDSDDDCVGELRCFERHAAIAVVPHCNVDPSISGEVGWADYCWNFPLGVPAGLGNLQNLGYGGCQQSPPEHQCNKCEGDCDSDAECAGHLRCFTRSGNEQTPPPIPGCPMEGSSEADRGLDYCWDPEDLPSQRRTTYHGYTYYYLQNLGYDGCTPDHPCTACRGDCDDDADCLGDGLRCFQRYDNGRTQEDIPPFVRGCISGGPQDVYNADYCWDHENAPAGMLPLQLPPVVAPVAGEEESPEPEADEHEEEEEEEEEEVEEERVATVTFSFTNLDYDAVLGDPVVSGALVRSVTQGLAASLGVSESDIEVTLSRGSVVVSARVICSDPDAATQVQGQATAASATMVTSVSHAVSEVPGIQEAMHDPDAGLGMTPPITVTGTTETTATGGTTGTEDILTEVTDILWYPLSAPYAILVYILSGVRYMLERFQSWIWPESIIPSCGLSWSCMRSK